MKEKLENISFKYRVTLFTFLIFLFIGALCPISGADWKSYVISNEGVGSCRWNSDIGKMEIIAEYPTWQEAVNSKEFKMVLRASRYKDKEKLRKTRNAQNKRYYSKTAIYKPRR